MGLTYVTVRISNLTKSGTPYEAEFLVDTGSVDCMLPREHLIAAGVQPESKRAYELANGEAMEYEVGFARVSFLGSETVSTIIFGPSGTEPILGATALESTGIIVDPVSRTLKRLPAIPLKLNR